MPGFRCPFCGQIMSISSDTQRSHCFNFQHSNLYGPNADYSQPYAEAIICRCPNASCQQESLFICGHSGYIGNQVYPVYPQSTYIHFPEYVPQAIRSDYEQASLIVSRSPKAAATLARRCLQGMIRDFWGVTDKRSLHQEIDAIKDKVPASQWAAIDALRQLGNIGAHMEHDVNLIIDVDPDEAKKLLQLIELLIDKWYIARHDADALYADIISAGEAKAAARSPGQGR